MIRILLLILLVAVHSAPLKAEDYRGWDYVVERLKAQGISEELLQRVYLDPRMPEFTAVPFGLKPKETPQLYRGFTKKDRIAEAQSFLEKNGEIFLEAEKRYGVNRKVIAAIMLIESHFGKVTGQDLVINRLSRLGAASAPENVKANYERLRKDDPSVTYEAVAARARYLDETFFPELPAFFALVERTGIDPLQFYGSSAGAFGIPQFLPSAYMRHALDGDGDGVPSLFSAKDAAISIANFLHSNGWQETAPIKKKRQVLWQYNRSDAYIDAVLKVSDKLVVTKVKAPKVVIVRKRE